jgi:hypothetical protein
MGDIKGTKSALETFDSGGRILLERRIEHLQDIFGQCFLRYVERSRSLSGLTFSDSVFAYWSDPLEGRRFAPVFMCDLWESLDKSLVHFRGFLDSGPAIKETSAIQHALHDHPRFHCLLPTGIAMWSVAVAEASHFPDGLYVSCNLTERMPEYTYGSRVLGVEPFRFVTLKHR